mmetsp:Transcript_26463/g.42526  ORF Transcript_26463/g.42526 Transcript_26463/m.42526 type:complete len:584 (-) Transcript_26463:159-1910(-)
MASRLPVHSLLVGLFCLLQFAPIYGQPQAQCNIQMLLVIDESGSVEDDGFQDQLNFGAEVIRNTFNGIDIRQFGLFTFDSVPRLQFPFNFTSDGLGLADQVQVLQRDGGGGTRIDLALQQAIELFSDPTLPNDEPRTLVLLSDGGGDAGTQAAQNLAAQQLRDSGVLIFGIFIGNDPDGIAQLAQIASQPTSTFSFAVALDFDFGNIAQIIADQSCINATSLSEVCGVGDTVIRVNGSNLDGDDLLRCRFTFDDGESFVVPADPISGEAIRCQRPSNTSRTGNALVEVSRDGRSFAGGLNFRFVNNASNCVNLTAISVNCGTGDTEIIVNGSLSLNGDEMLQCRYTFEDNGETFISEADALTESSLRCRSANVTRTGNARVAVSVDNGVSFSGGDGSSIGPIFRFVSDINDCFDPIPDVRAAFALYGAVIPALLLLSLLALLDYKPALLKKKKVAPPPPVPTPVSAAAAEHPVEPAFNKKKWKEVNAGGYLWARSGGGTAPMRVNWAGVAPPMAPRDQDGRGDKVKVWDFDTAFQEGAAPGEKGVVKEEDKSALDDVVEEVCCCCCAFEKPKKASGVEKKESV